MPETTETVSIRINGDVRDIAESTSLTELVRSLGRDPDTPGVAIAVNDAVVRRALWDETLLASGDRVEIITASQGG